MSIIALVLLSVLFAAQGAAPAKVESTFDKKADFAALRTYSWTTGQEAFNRDAHRMIVAAVEAEMSALGFTKVTAGSDATLTYHTVTATNVDFDALDKSEREGRAGAAPTKVLGRLIVILRRGTSPQQLWSASTREFVDPDPAKLATTIRGVTARLFETYPVRKPARPQ